jgi:hypothetical protein
MKELLLGKKNIVKFVRASRLIHWMNEEFPVRGMILLARHPCAVIASQTSYKDQSWSRTQPPDQDNLQSAFNGWIPDDVFERFEPVLASARSTVEQLAVGWCLDTYFALCERGGFPGLITTYERLLTQETHELSRIFDWLGEPLPKGVSQTFDKASQSASDDLMTEDTYNQLSKWKKKLSTEQIEEILDIVEAFGLDFYTDALEPDYARIEGLASDVQFNATHTDG